MGVLKIQRQNRIITLDLRELREAIHYNPLTGVFTWRRNGKLAGCLKENRHGKWKQIGFRRERYSATHIAWVLMTGKWPEHRIGHYDHNPENTAWENLYEDNDNLIRRSRAVQCNNKTGTSGVVYRQRSERYEAIIHKDGQAVYLGSRVNKEDAETLRRNAEVLMDYHPNSQSNVSYAL